MPRTLIALALVLLALPATAQPPDYNHFPGTDATNDGRFVALAGPGVETLAQDSLTFLLAVPPGVDQFEIGIFDGETGMSAGGAPHWDNGTTQLQYALYYDPYLQGTTHPANLLGVWRGNQTNATAGSAWAASSANFPDNGWWNLVVDVPEPPDPLPGQAPSGASYYHLCVSYRASTTSAGLVDPCTGDLRPVDASPQTITNFKLRATANISVLSFAFAYEGALRFTGGNADPTIIYPAFDGTTFPGLGSTFWLTTPTTYDGVWEFDISVPTSTDALRLFGGDFDFGVRPGQTTTFPSGLQLTQLCADTDDPDTPNDAFFPPFAVMGGVRIDDSTPEGQRVNGGTPPDDSPLDAFRRTPCVRWSITSPSGDVYSNENPSSQREWEQFLISAEPGCDSSPTCDPLLSNCADHCVVDILPAGIWHIEIEGVDLSNLNAWHSDQSMGFCLGCDDLSWPYLVGDTVFADGDKDGEQDAGEPGIPGVLVELLDDNGQVLATRVTGDSGSGYGEGEWDACRERNTGTGSAVDEQGLYCFDVQVPESDGAGSETYTVRIAASNFLPGGALYDYFGASPEASRPSPEQSDDVVEGDDNVLTYDFGYYYEPCGECQGKVTLLTLRYNGTSAALVQVGARRGPTTDVVFAGTLQPGEVFTVVGPASGNGGFAGTLGTEIRFYVNGSYQTMMHTSCSQPIGPGTVAGDFEVLAGASRHGGPLCPLPEPTHKRFSRQLSSSDWETGEVLKFALDDHDNGRLCAPHRG